MAAWLAAAVIVIDGCVAGAKMAGRKLEPTTIAIVVVHKNDKLRLFSSMLRFPSRPYLFTAAAGCPFFIFSAHPITTWHERKAIDGRTRSIACTPSLPFPYVSWSIVCAAAALSSRPSHRLFARRLAANDGDGTVKQTD